MTKKLGRTMLIKQGDGEVSEAFTTLCGLNAKTMSINNNEIDVTSPDCTTPGGVMWTEVLAGVKRINLSGNGFFKEEANEARATAVAMSDDPRANYQVIVPGLGTFEGNFFLSTMEYGGESTGGVTYSLALGSNGAVTFAPEA